MPEAERMTRREAARYVGQAPLTVTQRWRDEGRCKCGSTAVVTVVEMRRQWGGPNAGTVFQKKCAACAGKCATSRLFVSARPL